MANFENLSSSEFTSSEEDLTRALDAWHSKRYKINFVASVRSHIRDINLKDIGMYNGILTRDGHNFKVFPH